MKSNLAAREAPGFGARQFAGTHSVFDWEALTVHARVRTGSLRDILRWLRSAMPLIVPETTL
jgi:hypothetical protein